MKIFTCTALVVCNLVFGSFLQAETKDLDPCVNDKQPDRNSWFLEINQGDAANRETLLESLRLLSTGGFALEQVFDLKAPALTLVISYQPGYWSDAETATRVKYETLKALSEKKGNALTCNGLATINPAIGVRPGELAPQ